MTQGWTALVPFAPPGQRKTRLTGALCPAEREALAGDMLGHVLEALRAVPGITRIIVHGPRRVGEADWRDDGGLPLNTSLDLALVELGTPLLVLFADLPLLSADDVIALLEAAEDGCAIAPDRHGTGTNALALGRVGPFRFAFGPDSAAKHTAQLGAAIVRTQGLGLDIDTPADLALAQSQGFRNAA